MLALAPTMPNDAFDPPTGPDGIGDQLLRRELKARLFGVEPVPIRVGRYMILERIGQGGMGVVYRARDESLARDVAVKLLSPGLATGPERFGREARALAQLAHPNVVTIHEVGTHEGRLYLAMEYVEGATLRAWLQTAPDRDQVLDVLRQAARGLLAAHDVGLVHRDFKPDNVIVGADGRVRILDFGLAKALTDGTRAAVHPVERDAAEAFVTVGGLGTPGYIAPEQLTGLSVDPRTDQYSFCVTAWEALFGSAPSSERGRIVVPPDADVPLQLRRALARGLSPDRDDRHPDLRPLLDALTPAAAEAPAARAPARWKRLLAVAGVGGLGLYGVCMAQPAEPELSDEEETTAAVIASDDDGDDDGEEAQTETVEAGPVECGSIRIGGYDRQRAKQALAQTRRAVDGLEVDDPQRAPLILDAAVAMFQARDAELACRSLERLTTRFPDAPEVETATCLMDAHCDPPLVGHCPDGFGVDPEHGCTSPEIECEPFASDREPSCDGEKVRCCVRESIAVEYELLEARQQGNPVVAKTMWGRLMTLVDLACAGGEAMSCRQAAQLAAEPTYGEPASAEEVLGYLTRGCDLGNATACKRLVEGD